VIDIEWGGERESDCVVESRRRVEWWRRGEREVGVRERMGVQHTKE
jgi:hypothetical protein